MPTTHSTKSIKIRMFRFLQLCWTEILTGQLQINNHQQYLKIFYENSSNDHLILDCPPMLLQNNKKCVLLQFKRLSKIQQQQSDKKIIYVWIDADPFSFSFLSQQKATQICQILQLMEQNLQIGQQQEVADLVTVQYVKSLIENNLTMASTLFINSNTQVLEILLKTTALILQSELTQNMKQSFFTLFKTAVRMGDKHLIQKFLQNQHYKIMLTILSWNPFNKPAFDYVNQYKKLIHIRNILNIKNHQIIESYETNAKIKFLRDVAACIFIEVQNQRTLQNIINVNNHKILSEFSKSQQILNQINDLAQKDPQMYLNIFVDLWQIYKNTSPDFQTRQIRQNFIKKFIQKDLHNVTLKAVNNILSNTTLIQQTSPRFHEKWIELFNPFLSFDWQYSQNWLIQKAQNQSLVNILYNVIKIYKDESLIATIINFISWFIEPSQNRLQIKTKLLFYVFNKFVGKLWDIMSNSIQLIQMYVQFVIKCYRIDMILTRRILIQDKVLYTLDKRITNKKILICIIKLLDAFVKQQNLDIFKYLTNNLLFTGLKEEYVRNASSRNIVNSCFRSLLTKIQKVQSQQVRKYFAVVFLKE